MGKDKIRFRDLSTPNKIAISLAWGIGVFYVILFGIGMLIGIVEVILGV